jgi:hypothetical protein
MGNIALDLASVAAVAVVIIGLQLKPKFNHACLLGWNFLTHTIITYGLHRKGTNILTTLIFFVPPSLVGSDVDVYDVSSVT